MLMEKGELVFYIRKADNGYVVDAYDGDAFQEWAEDNEATPETKRVAGDDRGLIQVLKDILGIKD